MTWDENYIYVCTSENTWSRSKLETVPQETVTTLPSEVPAVLDETGTTVPTDETDGTEVVTETTVSPLPLEDSTMSGDTGGTTLP